jgi:methionyl-tRNA synthetase
MKGEFMPRTFITATPPTPNGDLHVGHLSGPYLGADVCARYRRMLGENVTFITGTDANQTYVLSSAEKKCVPPQQMADFYAGEIIRTLQAANISFDAFVVPDKRHSTVVQDFYKGLYDRGLFTTKKKKTLWSEASERFADFAFVTGFCPNCFSETAESVCEACAHPVGPENIIDPRSATNSNERLTLRETDVLVLEIERYRPLLEKFYASKWGEWRPHVLELVEQMMAKPLPDFSLTCISSWGIPAPFPGFEGHVLSGWAELLPGFMRALEEASDIVAGDGPELWNASSGNRLIQFLGFDNAYFFAIPHVILSGIAEVPKIVPDPILTNEFYQLNGFKFSTSKNNVILARDIISTRQADELRLYLSLTNPELQKGNFSLSDMDRLLASKFIEPWERIVRKLNTLFSRHALGSEQGVMINDHVSRVEQLYLLLDDSYGTRRFSLQRAGEALVHFWSWFEHEIDEAGRSGELERIVSLWGVLESQATAMSPMLPDLAAQLMQHRVGSLRPTWRKMPATIHPFRLQEHEERQRGAA